MRSRLRGRLVVTAAAALAACIPVTGCASTGVSAGRLEGSVASTFTRMYTWQQRLQGHPAPGRLDARAGCLRGTSGATGAGPDWTCTIQYLQSGPGTPVSFSYDLDVHPDGCWTAENGPPSLGPRELRTKGGGTAPNPVYTIDGCFPAT